MPAGDREDKKKMGEDEILRVIAETTVYATGLEFLRLLVKTLADVMQVKYAFVAEFLDNDSIVHVLTFWDGLTIEEGERYPLPGTPCATVLNGQIAYFPENVSDVFPVERPLDVESYLAIPLLSESRAVLGHLAVMDTRPMKLEPRELDVLRIFGGRACAELQRKRSEDALRASEQTVSRILSTATDAIIAINAERRITLFNPAAERIFACAAGWAIGQPFDRFLSKPFRSLMEDYLQAADRTEGSAEPMWAPQGLTALRANREEFPVEGTISACEAADGGKAYTLILRDVNERMVAQEKIDRLQQQNVFLIQEIVDQYRFEDMIGGTPVMKQLFDSIARVAPSDATVLVSGETGTGKEQIAHAIHNLSGRKHAMLVKMNCAALPGELIESELFGHEKGAFTGATAMRKGRFEMADGGTLFLDEVGELTLPAQAKLLRVLQEQEFERVGGTRTIRVDVRVIAATNRDLAGMVRAGTFRSDLYYRLNVFPLQLPPLRDRPGDIPALVEHFIARSSRKLGRGFTGIDQPSLQRLMSYGWPGNIRELQNVIERAAILCTGSTLTVGDLAVEATPPVSAPGADLTLRTLEDVEQAHITATLQQCDWVIEGKRGAATILGLEPSTLRYRMQKLGIKRPRATND